MNLNTNPYANASKYPASTASLYSSPTGMYSSTTNSASNVNVGPGSAAIYATTSPALTAPTSAYHGAMQAGGSPQITHQQPQGTVPSYNTYSSAPSGAPAAGAVAAAGRPGEIFYHGATMSGHPSAAGQPMYSTAGPTTALFHMGASSALTQGPSGPQMLSAQQQQQQMNASAAALAAYGNPATNINVGYKLFVGQVPAVCTEEQLRPLFAQFGRLLEIKIMREPNGRSRGSAWVRYEAEISARRAIEALNEKHVVPPQTNALRVQFATPSQNRTQVVPAQLQPAALQSPPMQAAQRGYGTTIITSSPPPTVAAAATASAAAAAAACG